MMCPYCGEEVPVDSNRCWKCGTDLPEGAARERDDLDAHEDDDGPPGADLAASLASCPRCDAPVPRKARRCHECGHALERAEDRGRPARAGAWLTVLTVGLGAATLAVVLSLHTFRRERSGSPHTDVTWPKLHEWAKLKEGEGKAEDRRREVWRSQFERHYVTWKGVYYLQRDPQDSAVAWFTHEKGGALECRVRLREEPADGVLKPGEACGYSARLTDPPDREGVLTLEDGQVLPKETN